MTSTLSIRKLYTTCILVILLGAVSIPIAGGEADAGRYRGDSKCWFGPVPEGTDPCGLIGQAQELLVQLPDSAAKYVRELAAGMELERSLRIQQKLLREHLVWLDDDLTERQLDLIVFLAVALSLDRAQDKTAELHRLLEEKSEPALEQSLQSVELYRSQALSVLSELSPRIEDMSDPELRIRF
jgi:hypothetical protein